MDSIGAAPLKKTYDDKSSVGDSNMGVKARIISNFVTRVTGVLAKTNTWLFVVNHMYESLSAYDPAPKRAGGKKLGYHSSTIVSFKSKKEKTTDAVEYVDVVATIDKNKIAEPFKKAEYRLYLDGSIEPISQLINIITNSDNYEALGITQAGPMYTMPQEMFPSLIDLKFKGQNAIAEVLADFDTLEAATNYVKERLMR